MKGVFEMFEFNEQPIADNIKRRQDDYSNNAKHNWWFF